MKNEITAKNNALSPRETLSQYVHDMAELEKKEFTITQTVKSLREKADEMEEIAKADVCQHEENLARAKERLKRLNEYSPPKEPEKASIRENITWGNIGCGFLLGPILISPIIGGLAYSLSPEQFYNSNGDVVPPVWFLLTLLIGPTIIVLVNYFLQKKNNKKHYIQTIKSHPNNLRSANIAVAEEQDYLKEVLERKKNADFAVSLLRKQADMAYANASTIAQKKQALYNLDVIPPDYRESVCVIELDHIFRNKLADTMSEAILIYDERAHRAIMQKCMEEIYSLVTDIADSVSHIESEVRELKMEVHSIGDELFAMAENTEKLAKLQREGNKTQEKILEETRASRYSQQAVAQSAQKYDWYMEQYRQGLL